jgi:hypothetical protein
MKEKDVPGNIRYDFVQKFPEAEGVVWMQEGEKYIGARFQDQKAATEVVYLTEGEWQQTVKEITFRDLPDSAAHYCKLNYGALTLSKVNRVTTRRYGILYDVIAIDNLKKVTLSFDMSGTLLDEKEELLKSEKETGQEPAEEKKTLGSWLNSKKAENQ